MKFGADSQSKIAGFSENILKSTMTKDSGEVGTLLIDLSGKLKGFDSNLESRFFKKNKILSDFGHYNWNVLFFIIPIIV